jgi:hypothetical protein
MLEVIDVIDDEIYTTMAKDYKSAVRIAKNNRLKEHISNQIIVDIDLGNIYTITPDDKHKDFILSLNEYNDMILHFINTKDFNEDGELYGIYYPDETNIEDIFDNEDGEYQ